MALTTNMDAVCRKNGNGLCNAVALSGGDKKLGRMVWDCEYGGSCRKLRFASGGDLDENTQTSIPLLSLRQYNKLPDHQATSLRMLVVLARVCGEPSSVFAPL